MHEAYLGWERFVKLHIYDALGVVGGVCHVLADSLHNEGEVFLFLVSLIASTREHGKVELCVELVLPGRPVLATRLYHTHPIWVSHGKRNQSCLLRHLVHLSYLLCLLEEGKTDSWGDAFKLEGQIDNGSITARWLDQLKGRLVENEVVLDTLDRDCRGDVHRFNFVAHIPWVGA